LLELLELLSAMKRFRSKKRPAQAQYPRGPSPVLLVELKK